MRTYWSQKLVFKIGLGLIIYLCIGVHSRKMISFVTRKLYDNHISENKIDIGKKGKRSKWS